MTKGNKSSADSDRIDKAIREHVTIPDLEPSLGEVADGTAQYCPLVPQPSKCFFIRDNGRRFECQHCKAEGDIFDFIMLLNNIKNRKIARAQLYEWVPEEHRPKMEGSPVLRLGLDKKGNERPVHILVTEEILRNWHIVTVGETGATYIYKVGRYVIDPHCNEILSIAAVYMGDRYNTNSENNVKKYIKRRTRRTYAEFKQSPHLLNLKDGILDIETMILEPHTPEFLSFELIPIIYDSEADCPQFEAFVKQVVSTPIQATHLQEYFGYCFWKEGCPFDKALALQGGGHNGKSVLINVFKSVLGKENICAVTPHKLENDTQGPLQLMDKLANLVFDVSPEALRKTDMLKKSISGELIGARPVYCRDYIQFEPYAKHIFAWNKAPKPHGDDTDAFYRRFIVVKFIHNFNGETCHGCGETHEEDIYLTEKLKKEQVGIFNWAMEGLKRILEQGGFSHAPSVAKTREAYHSSMDPVETFADLHLAFTGDAKYRLEKAIVYAEFKRWAAEKGVPILDEREFGRHLKRVFPTVKSGKTTGSGARRNTHIGLAWKSQIVEVDEHLESHEPAEKNHKKTVS